jgi:hypothetical protein
VTAAPVEPDTGLIRDLGALLAPERVLARPIDLVARSVDASIYRLIPRVVVRPRDLDEVRALLAYTRAHGRHLTFRTAGTSLSGQAVTDDILVELAPFWKAYRVLDGGALQYVTFNNGQWSEVRTLQLSRTLTMDQAISLVENLAR